MSDDKKPNLADMPLEQLSESMAKGVTEWDEQQRGPEQSTNKGEVIYKFQMPVAEEFRMDLPIGAEILRVANEGGFLWMWARVNTNNDTESRKFRAFKTGGTIPSHVKEMKATHETICWITIGGTRCRVVMNET